MHSKSMQKTGYLTQGRLCLCEDEWQLAGTLMQLLMREKVVVGH